MNLTTRAQRMAEMAFGAVSKDKRIEDKEYRSFAKSFPSLIQSAGLCQAVAFALSKGKGDPSKAHTKVLNDILATIDHSDLKEIEEFARSVREVSVVEYMHLSRTALHAAIWVKRYVEALEKPQPEPQSQPHLESQP